MPYTKQVDRPKFKQVILDSVGLIMSGPEASHVKAEFFGYWVNRTALAYARHPHHNNQSFNSYSFNAEKKNKLSALADKAASLVASAGDLNYVISCVNWGILGDAKDVPYANYEFRAYTKGCIRRVIRTLSTVIQGNDKDAVVAFRRALTAETVLDDVILECYRMKTAVYEDEKIKENLTLWKDGELILSMEDQAEHT